MRRLPAFDRITEVVSGGAGGVDKLGELWAERNRVTCRRFLANWGKYGKSAGMRRNEEMARYAVEKRGGCIAIWDGKSVGTKNMIETAQRYGLVTAVWWAER